MNFGVGSAGVRGQNSRRYKMTGPDPSRAKSSSVGTDPPKPANPPPSWMALPCADYCRRLSIRNCVAASRRDRPSAFVHRHTRETTTGGHCRPIHDRDRCCLSFSRERAKSANLATIDRCLGFVQDRLFPVASFPENCLSRKIARKQATRRWSKKASERKNRKYCYAPCNVFSKRPLHRNRPIRSRPSNLGRHIQPTPNNPSAGSYSPGV